MNNKKLVRPRNGRKISGVCLGIAEYFGIDVTVIRVLWVLGTLLFLGTGIILYIACVFIAVSYTHLDVYKRQLL